MSSFKKEHLLVAGLIAVISITAVAVIFSRPSLEYLIVILCIPLVIYSLLKLSERY